MKVLILTTDAGGGHRSVAKALAAGFAEISGGQCSTQIVDYLARYAPFPLSHTRQLYSFFMRHPPLWGLVFSSTNQRYQRDGGAPAVGLAMQAGVARLLREHRPDVIVATHPLAAPALNALLRQRRHSVPYYTVVTDFGGVHTWWSYPFGELWFAPCRQTARHLARSGVPRGRIVVSGYPVHPQFARPAQSKAELRVALGLEPDRFTVLLMGGAEGVGPLEAIVDALAGTPAPWQLIVVAGRNRVLKERLDAQAGRRAIPVHVDGLVEDMPSRMWAADLLLSKGGPATLSEGVVCGLPALVTSVLPGQEEDDVAHFERLGVARRVSGPAALRAAVAELAAPGSPQLNAMRAGLGLAAVPTAALDIARTVLNRGTVLTASPVSPFFWLRPRRLRMASKSSG